MADKPKEQTGSVMSAIRCMTVGEIKVFPMSEVKTSYLRYISSNFGPEWGATYRVAVNRIDNRTVVTRLS